MSEPVEHHYYTPEEYFAIEERAEYRSEYIDGEIFAMAGGTANHNRITVVLSRKLDEIFEKDGRCEVFAENVRLQIQANRHYTYPDIIIVCGKPEFDKCQKDTMTNPVVIIEVLSDSTEAYDRGSKFEAYRQIEAFREYILIDQERVHIETFVKSDDGSWNWREYSDHNNDLPFVSLNITIPIQEIYRRVEFPSEPQLIRVKVKRRRVWA
jgi:Uma2 family endonuclease